MSETITVFDEDDVQEMCQETIKDFIGDPVEFITHDDVRPLAEAFGNREGDGPELLRNSIDGRIANAFVPEVGWMLENEGLKTQVAILARCELAHVVSFKNDELAHVLMKVIDQRVETILAVRAQKERDALVAIQDIARAKGKPATLLERIVALLADVLR